MMDRNLGNVVTDSIVVRIWDTYIEKCKEEGLMASSGSSTPKSKGFDLEGSPSRPGSRQPLAARPVANGVSPGTPIYPILSEENKPEFKPPDATTIRMPTEQPIPIVANVASAEPQIEITVEPPEYNHFTDD
jgi:hypothetical protein